MLRVLLSVAAVLVLATPVLAADVGVFFDLNGQETTATANAFQTFQWHVLSSEGNLKGFEFAVVVDAAITVTQRTLHPSTGLNVGQGDNFIVGTGQCHGSGLTALVSYSAMLLSDAENLPIRLEPASPSSFSPATPGYLTCDDALNGFTQVTPAVLNSKPDSWGKLKNRYGG